MWMGCPPLHFTADEADAALPLRPPRLLHRLDFTLLACQPFIEACEYGLGGDALGRELGVCAFGFGEAGGEDFPLGAEFLAVRVGLAPLVVSLFMSEGRSLVLLCPSLVCPCPSHC